ncbi:MAG: hypothetical protein AABM29_03010 [Actinomycetota bacterium]
MNIWVSSVHCRRGGGIVGVLAASLLVVAVSPCTASASPTQSLIFDPGTSALGLSIGKRAQLLQRLSRQGVDVVRMLLPWRQLAPSPEAGERPEGFDPRNPSAYRDPLWGAVDHFVTAASARGMKVMLVPSSPIPNWASASGSSALEDPLPDEFQSFVTAVGLRYSGFCDPHNGRENCFLPAFGGESVPLPRVLSWAVWNEPNLSLFLRPQFSNGVSQSGRLYRQLFLAAKAGFAASGHGGDRVLIGETSPGPGVDSTSPLAFLRDVFCLDQNYQPVGGCAPIEASGWGHHPYDPYDPPFAKSRNLLMVGNLARLRQALSRSARAGATSRVLPVYVTEYGVPTGREGVSRATQVKYMAIAEYLLYGYRWVRSSAQYLLNDDPPSSAISFTTGLRVHNGAAKPSYDAFAMTFLVRRVGARRVRIWGNARPRRGKRTVEVSVKEPVREVHPGRGTVVRGRLQHLRTVRTNRRGYFSFMARFRPGRRWAAASKLPGGRVLRTSFVRAYRF